MADEIRSTQNIAQVEWQDLLIMRMFSLIAQVEWVEGTAGWTGKISGVTNPAKINGVVVTNISKVMGIS